MDKAILKKKEKIIEDKTFGLKNKNKSKAVQRYIESVKTKVLGQQRSNAEKAREERARKEALEEKARQEELNRILRATVLQQKVKEGEDPKSVVCEYFKRGLCTKGDKCKFSHDLTIGRKAAKKSVYSDKRAEEEEKKRQDTMDKWDQETLEKVVEQKHGKKNKGLPPTTIVCKYFLDAVEKSQYGWFWQCPNGDRCHYRHALPPGFQLKKKGEEKKQDEDEGPSLEEVLENQRKLLVGGTPVTLETFLEWKKKKIAEKEAAEKKEKDALRAKAADSKGRIGVGLTGRDLFAFNPEMFQDDEDAVGGDVDYAHREEEEEEEPASSSSVPSDAAQTGEQKEGEEEPEDDQDDISEEELKRRYGVTSESGPIDASLFAGGDEALDDLDDDSDEEKEEKKEEGEKEEKEEKKEEVKEEVKEEEKEVKEEKEEQKTDDKDEESS